MFNIMFKSIAWTLTAITFFAFNCNAEEEMPIPGPEEAVTQVRYAETTAPKTAQSILVSVPQTLLSAKEGANFPKAPARAKPKVKGWQSGDDVVGIVASLPKENSQATEESALKTAITATLSQFAKRPMSMQTNRPSEILALCNSYGTETLVFQPGLAPQTPATGKSSAQKQSGDFIYAIGGLCWNYPAAEHTLLRTDGKSVFAKVGYGYQRQPASFLAMLAMSKVDANYQIRIGSNHFTIHDLVESEKSFCASGNNMALALLGLSFYVPCEENWTNAEGESWTLTRVVSEELKRKPDQGSSDVTDQLLGFASVIKHFEDCSIPLDGPLTEAKEYVVKCQKFVMEARNEQSLWHPEFFLYRGSSSDMYETLYSSGHILRFLIYSLPADKMDDPSVLRSVTAINSLLNKIPANTSFQSLTERQVESVTVSLQALSMYNQKALTK